VATDVNGEQPKTTTPLKVAIVDVSDTVKTTAVDRAEERLTAEAAELKGVKGFFKKVWKFNVAREYYRQREIARAKKEIVGQDDLYGNKAASQEARAATVDRFMSDCDEAIHKEAGETKGTGNDEVQQAVRELIREFSAGRLDEAHFQESKNRIFSATKEKDSPGLLYADNMLEVAKQIKEQVAHGVAIEALMEDFQVVVGRAKMGVRTEAQFNAIDRLTSKIMNTRVGCWIGETTVASAMSIAYCIGQNLGVSWMRSKVAQVGSFGATALVTGAIAGAKEGYRVEEERKKHFRDMAKGRSFDTVKDKRRIEMERVRYETKSAGSLTEGLREGIDNLDAGLNADNAKTLVGLLAETEARIRLSDQRKIDLLSYSDEKKVEQERFELDKTRAAAKVMLEKLVQRDGIEGILGGKTWEDFLSGAVGAKMEELRGGEIDPKNRLFNKMKTKRVAGAVAKGVISGIVIGGITQEISAFFDPTRQGLVETLVTGKNAVATGATHLTPLESLRSYISGDWKKVIGFREEMINGVNFKVPDGTHFVNRPDGTMALMGDKNQEIVGGLRFDAKGGLTDDSRHLLESRGGIFAGTNREIERQMERMTQRTVGVDEFVAKKPELFHHITRLGWYDNDTEGVFDKNELRLLWGGVSGNGVDANGNYVLDVSQMMTDGSYHGGLSADAMELARQGKLFLSLSVSEGTQTQIVKVAIDATGKAVTAHDSEFGRMLFETTGDGQARFLGKFAEVCQSVGTADDGAEQVRVLATAVGRGIEGNLTIADKVVETVKSTVTDWAVSMPAPEQVFDTLVDVPPIIPITWRTPLEKLKEAGSSEPVVEQVPQATEPESAEVVLPMIETLKGPQVGPLSMPEINGMPEESEEIPLMPKPKVSPSVVNDEGKGNSKQEVVNPWNVVPENVVDRLAAMGEEEEKEWGKNYWLKAFDSPENGDYLVRKVVSEIKLDEPENSGEWLSNDEERIKELINLTLKPVWHSFVFSLKSNGRKVNNLIELFKLGARHSFGVEVEVDENGEMVVKEMGTFFNRLKEVRYRPIEFEEEEAA